MTDGERPPAALGLLLGLAALKFAVHASTFDLQGGYFRDELYFLDCARHLDWGYVDHAPLVAWVARLALALGGSLPALRVFPALAGALLVILAGLLTWLLGGGRFAQGLAGLAIIVAPVYLAIDSFLSMNAFEPLFWMGCVLVVVLILRGVDPRLWLLGLVALLRGREKGWRALGWTYVVFTVTLFALEAKHYYLAPIYPILFAAGAVALEAGVASWPWSRGRVWPRAAVVALIAVAGAVLAPVVLPLLPPERHLAYQRWLGFNPPRTEVGHRAQLPQILADRYGWGELVAEVARIHQALPPEERAKAAIFAGNYGQASAINMFGPRYGLPTAISGHQSYYLWGPGPWTGEVGIVVGTRRKDLESVCASVEQAGEHSHPWGMDEENGPIHVCRGLQMSVGELWPRLKKWN